MTRVPRRWAFCALAGRALCSTATSRPPAPSAMNPRRSKVDSADAASSDGELVASAFLAVIEIPPWWNLCGFIAQLSRDGQWPGTISVQGRANSLRLIWTQRERGTIRAILVQLT